MKSVMEYSKFVVALSLENQDKLDRIFLLLFSTVYILLIYRNHYILYLGMPLDNHGKTRIIIFCLVFCGTHSIINKCQN